jgi:hypothetical protein
VPLPFPMSVGLESRPRDRLAALTIPGTAMAAMKPGRNEIGCVCIIGRWRCLACAQSNVNIILATDWFGQLVGFSAFFAIFCSIVFFFRGTRNAKRETPPTLQSFQFGSFRFRSCGDASFQVTVGRHDQNVVQFHMDRGKALDHIHGGIRSIIDNLPAGIGSLF